MWAYQAEDVANCHGAGGNEQVGLCNLDWRGEGKRLYPLYLYVLLKSRYADSSDKC